jgi:hypothetical protein
MIANFPDRTPNSTIYLFSHGNPGGTAISPHMKGNERANIIRTPEDLVEFLNMSPLRKVRADINN